MTPQQPGDGAKRTQPDPVTSLSLLQRARSNDQVAWDRLFYLYRPLMLHWCSKKGVRNEDGDDVVQDVFRDLAHCLDSFEKRPGGTFRGWLRGVTNNRLLMHFRRTSKHAQAEGGSSALARLEQVADPCGENEDDPAELVGGLYRRGLELVRAEFEERTWEMFWRSVIDARPPMEVAAAMGVSDAAIRQAKSRVLRRLREEVGDLID